MWTFFFMSVRQSAKLYMLTYLLVFYTYSNKLSQFSKRKFSIECNEKGQYWIRIISVLAFSHTESGSILRFRMFRIIIKLEDFIYDNSYCIYFIKRFSKKHFITMMIDYAAVTVTLPSVTSK